MTQKNAEHTWCTCATHLHKVSWFKPAWRWRWHAHALRTHEDRQRRAGGAVQQLEAESDPGCSSGAQQQQLRGLPRDLQVRRRLGVGGEAGQSQPERPVHTQQREKCGFLQNRKNIRGKKKLNLLQNCLRSRIVSPPLIGIFAFNVEMHYCIYNIYDIKVKHF